MRPGTPGSVRLWACLACCIAVSAAWPARAQVDEPPTVALLEPHPFATFHAPGVMAVSADATDDGAVVSVEFLVDGTVHETDAEAPFEGVLSGFARGAYSIAVRATDDTGNTTLSPPSYVLIEREAQGPGIPNDSYSTDDLFETIGRIDQPLEDPNDPASEIVLGVNHAAMHRGYLVLPQARNAGRSGGAISAWDLSDPRAPQLLTLKRDAQTSPIREAHGFGISDDDVMALQATDGVMFWNISDPTNPVRLSYLLLPGMGGEQSYRDSSWWVHSQAPLHFVGGLNLGLFVVDASNPREPTLVTHLPTSAIGGAVGPIHAVGNLLFVSPRAGSPRTVDISDPANPLLLDVSDDRRDYGTAIHGDSLFGVEDSEIRRFDVQDPANIFLAETYEPLGPDADLFYVTLQDEFMHVPDLETRYAKVRIDDGSLVGVTPSLDPPRKAFEFASLLGNLVLVSGGGNGVGGRIIPHDTRSDTRGPDVMRIVPADGAVHQALTSRVGVVFGDWIDLASVDTDGFIVRPVGGAPLPGRYSHQFGVVNFNPDTPLAPDTTYEVVIAASGVTDIAGNGTPGLATRFSTGASVLSDLPPTVSIATPQTGDPISTQTPTTVEVVASDPEGTNVSVALLDEGVLVATTSGPPHSFSWQASGAGPHELVARATDLAGNVAEASVIVNVETSAGAPDVTLLSPQMDETFDLPVSVAVDASVVENGEALADVSLQVDGSTVESRSAPPYGFSWLPAVAGDYLLQVVATAANGAVGASVPVVVHIQGVSPPLDATLLPMSPTPIGAPLVLDASGGVGAGLVEFSWSFGDGTPDSPWSPSPQVAHIWAAPGRHVVILRIRDALSMISRTFTQVVHRPIAPGSPARSSTVAVDALRRRVWNVNPDQDTLTSLDADSLAVRFEVDVGADPRSVAVAPDGNVWVAERGAHALSVLDGSDGSLLATYAMPEASQPGAVLLSQDGARVYVTLEALGEVLELDAATGIVLRTADVGPRPRGLALAADELNLYVARFISPATHGEMVDIDLLSFGVNGIAVLPEDPGPDSIDSGRGVPNYLGQLAIAPDGERVAIPSKKDNTSRGLARDGLPLTFESTVRAMVAQVELDSFAENLSVRADIDDAALPSAVAWSPLGDLVFVTLLASNDIAVLDSETGDFISGVGEVGLAPDGLALDATTGRLFVHAFLERAVTVIDVSTLLDATADTASIVATVDVTSSERIPQQVRRGKEIFYDASDSRMSAEGYLACVVCHLDGGHDGRVWDFTDRGEGLRNTQSLRGQGGTLQGPMHWTGNFDEVQDFEADIRGPFGGGGFADDADYFVGTRSDPLGDPLDGVSADLDALAAYLESLDVWEDSPYRSMGGAFANRVVLGRNHFDSLGCAECHGGEEFTDSALGLRHDVGTLTPLSGDRIGAPLDGLDTPTLRGVWKTAPYLHDGSAPTLRNVLERSGPEHGNAASLAPRQRKQLESFLLQLDGEEPAPPLPPTP